MSDIILEDSKLVATRDVSHQSLLAVPDEILNLQNLTNLYLNGNYIWHLPEDFFERLPMLNYLNLQGNDIVYIPASIAYHENLETLLLDNNKIGSLPEELGFVPNLKLLTLEGNPIVYPPQRIIDYGIEGIKIFLKDEYFGRHGRLPPVTLDLQSTSEKEKELMQEIGADEEESLIEIEDLGIEPSMKATKLLKTVPVLQDTNPEVYATNNNQ